ncbi:hypothetical protein [Nocardia huaxiensis]|uniref:Low molecular weight antigen MTB12-like C-terminal domain-containing protein n=1 Tax=Nocardia huaxiensis TaxID=2755382 RepID=A0A7D6VHR4_9NOCA|nr:hypothetical protein [Nocardia huaxiensis]QLY33157.1 hypothetical protein H0264_13805 [Nocardia huaxiensis]UFS93070.1 hypothetical protein LPY97_19555 [Nocardia huaxiensis]
MVRKFVAASMSAAALLLPVSAAVVVSAPAAIAAPATPSAGELQGKLQSALNGNAAELESGDASQIVNVGTTIARIPGYSWDVSGVSVDGDVLSATLNSRLGSYSFPIPLTWKNIGGTWKLSQESQDTLVSYANMAW